MSPKCSAFYLICGEILSLFLATTMIDSNDHNTLSSYWSLSLMPNCGHVSIYYYSVIRHLELLKAIKLDHAVATGLECDWLSCNIYLCKANWMWMKKAFLSMVLKANAFPQDLLLNKFKGTSYVESCMYCNVSNKSIIFWQQNVTAFQILIITSSLLSIRLL